jgi:hypothetical protein
MHYETNRKPVPEIAQELQVDGVIEGSVVHADDTVRITARLIEGVSGNVLWAKSFEGELRNVLALQHDVARAISSKVGIRLTPQEQARLGSARPVDPEVHRQVLLGWYHANKRTEEGLRSAVSSSRPPTAKIRGTLRLTRVWLRRSVVIDGSDHRFNGFRSSSSAQ